MDVNLKRLGAVVVAIGQGPGSRYAAGESGRSPPLRDPGGCDRRLVGARRADCGAYRQPWEFHVPKVDWLCLIED
jgi:hypothetical protein